MPRGVTPGAVAYGPDLNAAAVLLTAQGNVLPERAGRLIADLLGVQVSTGFVAKAHARLADLLDAAGFDAAMRAALGAEEVLCADETPVELLHPATGTAGELLPGAPHTLVVGTPDARLVWFAAMNSRSGQQLQDLGALETFTGVLVRDDYAAWHRFDDKPAGVQLCAAHLIRSLKGVHGLHASQQSWAGQVIDILREAHQAVEDAKAAGAGALDAKVLADLRERYDEKVRWGS